MVRYTLQGETQDGKNLEIPIVAAYDENGNKFAEYYAQRPEYEEIITNLSALSAKLLAPHTYALSITQGEKTTITVCRTSSLIKNVTTGALSNGDLIYRGDVLLISATASDGYKVSAFTVNADAWTSGDSITVSSSVAVATTAELQPYYIHGSVSGGDATFTFNRTSSPLKNAATGVITSSSPIYYGDVITVSVAADEGYSISTLTVNGEAWTSGKSITVSGSIQVKAEAYCKNYQLSISQGDNTEISVNRTSSPLQDAYTGIMLDGSTVYYGDVLTITVTANSGYNVSTFTVNGSNWTSGNSITVSEAVSVVTKAEVKSYALLISQGADTTVTVNRTSSPYKGATTGTLSSGGTVYHGDVLTFSATASDGYNISTFTVNGNSWTSGNSLTVSGAVTAVTAAEVKSYALLISQGADTTVTVNRTSSPLKGATTGTLSNGGTVYYGDALTISATVSTGYRVSTFTVNGAPTDSSTVILVDGAVTVVTTAEVIPLEDCSWSTIGTLSKSGKAESLYNVGDEKTITLTTGEEITLQILGFNHDDLADGSGKAGITFGMKNLLATTYPMNSKNTNVGGWESSLMRTSTMGTLLSQLPSDLKSVIKSVSKKATAGNKLTTITTSTDKLFLFANVELTGNTSTGYVDEGSQYKYWKTHNANSDKIKYLSNGDGASSYWYLRSPDTGTAVNFGCVIDNGWVLAINAGNAVGVCFGFCV